MFFASFSKLFNAYSKCVRHNEQVIAVCRKSSHSLNVGSLITSVSFSKMVWNELIIKVKARNSSVYSKENSFDCSKEKPCVLSENLFG